MQWLLSKEFMTNRKERWLRGMRKDALHYDGWIKDIDPSHSLRTWFGHKPERFAEFAKRYKAELKENAALDELKQLYRKHKISACLLQPKMQHTTMH